MRIPKNEGRCLDAVIRVMELELGQTRKNLISPEQSGHKHPVELVCEIGNSRYAFEHTIVQSFPNQITDGFKFIGMTDTLITELEENLPKNVFVQVVIEIGATDGIKQHEVSKIKASLGKWIISTAHQLSPKGNISTEYGKPDGVPFSVSLNMQSWHGPTKIHFARGVNELTLEEARFVQLAAGISNKISKLQGWAKNDVQDILILENWDGALSNFEIVKNTFEKVSKQFMRIPSSVYIVDTSLNTQWTVWAIRRNDINEVNPMCWDVNPSKLSNPIT
jgi:hypothetical protein